MKKKLLILHGALGCKKQFLELMDLLKPHYEIYALNFDGHGGEPVNAGFSINDFAKKTIGFIGKNKIGKVNVFGYSMGGYVALKMASSSPDLIANIMTLGTKFDWTEDFAKTEAGRLNPAKIAEKVPKFAAYLKALHSEEKWWVLLENTAKLMLGLGGGGGLKKNEITAIKNKVLICVGGLDKMVTKEESEQVSNLLPNGQVKIIENMQHPIEKVDMRKLAGAIIDFI